MYEDITFPAAEHSLFWRGKLDSMSAEMANNYLNGGVNEWARPSEIMKSGGSNKAPSLWGDTGRPQPGGIQQGMLGDCWFLSSASSLAEYPERIERIFTNTEYSKEGAFEIQFFWSLGTFRQIVDDRIPVTTVPRGYVGAGTKRPFNSKVGSNGGWWLTILEKAYAKFNGNYSNLNGGQPEQALRELSGMPSVGYRTNSQDDNAIFNTVNSADTNKWVMTAACMYQHDSLVTGHAYSILGAVEVDGNKLLKMRNPWGNEKYKGPWHDGDSRWTSSAK